MAAARGTFVLACLALTAVVLPAAALCDYEYGSYDYYEQIIHPVQPCPSMCKCNVCSYHVEVICDGRNLTEVPVNISDFTSQLTMNNNHIPVLSYDVFPEEMRKLDDNHGLTAFFTLEMRNSSVTEIRENAFAGMQDLELIDLSHNSIREIHEDAFSGLLNLQTLKLDHNSLRYIHVTTFERLPRLTKLYLNNNKIVHISKNSFLFMNNLQELHLNDNLMIRVGEGIFHGLDSLSFLYLYGNNISSALPEVFDDTLQLTVLDLSYNQLTETFLTTAFTKTSRVAHLSLAYNNLSILNATTLRHFPKLRELDLTANKIARIDDFAFQGMHDLSTLRLSFNRLFMISENIFDESVMNLKELHLNRNNLTEFDDGLFLNLKSLVYLQCEFNQFLHTFPVFMGSSRVQKIYLHMTSIQVIPADLCTWTPNLIELDVAVSSVRKVADFHKCKGLMHLYLSGNMITSRELEGKLTGLSNMMDITLYSNNLNVITNTTFDGMKSLELLDIHNNPISHIWTGAFASFEHIRHLNLKNTQFKDLPTAGLKTVEALSLSGNTDMIVFPSIEHFPKLKRAFLNYPYHCCLWKEFMPKKRAAPDEANSENVHESVHKVPIADDETLRDDGFVVQRGVVMYDYPTIGDYYSSGVVSTVDYDDINEVHPTVPYEQLPVLQRVVECTPIPNALTPCVDLLEYWWLRLFVWLFMLIALAANAVVFFIIMTTRSRQAAAQTARFFVTFLAIADFSLGLYLAFIAFVDILTTGEYARHALKWKVSTSCKASGFFAIFGSVLSIWTLTAITLDRLLAVTFAVRRFKISKGKAWAVMGFGVMAAIVIALLPLVGVSRYTNVGVCLPFDISTAAAKVYVTFLLILPLVAVLIISCSYFKLYRMYSNSSAWNASETRVAFRVALLVFFNCACWVPIAVIGLLVIYGNRDDILQTSVLDGNDSGKISLFVAKVLVAIFFPINAVFDPFFYAISTPYFRRDITNLLKKIKTKIQKINIGRSFVSSRSRRPSVSSGPNRPIPMTRGVGMNNPQCGGSSSPDLSSRVRSFPIGHSVQTRETMLSPNSKNARSSASTNHRVAESVSVDSASRNAQPNMSASDTSNSNYNIHVVQTTADTHNNSNQYHQPVGTPDLQCSLTDNTNQNQLVYSNELNHDAVALELPQIAPVLLPIDIDSDSQQDASLSSLPPRPRTVQFKNSVVRMCDEHDPDLLYMAQETSV